jgi:hypothetical protein
VAVLLEEYGHYVDSRINTKDAAGDEGNIFARLVEGKSISQQELAVLQAEDDTATVMLNGQTVEIEQNSSQVTFVGVGIDPANKLILQEGSYTKDKITYKTTQILMGGTGKDLKSIKDNDVLAELIGVTPNQLLGSSRVSLTRDPMTSNFMFGTQGTIWDDGLNSSSSGTDLLRLL